MYNLIIETRNATNEGETMETIYLTMRDTRTDKEVTREIDISNFYVNGGDCHRVERNPEAQREMLIDWIEWRGNEQHDTELALVSWYTK